MRTSRRRLSTLAWSITASRGWRPRVAPPPSRPPPNRRKSQNASASGGAQAAIGVAHVLPAGPQLDRRLVLRGGGGKVLRAHLGVAFLDELVGLLIAVRLRVLTRKTLGGLQTDLSGRVLRSDGMPLAGLYAAGEVAGFGGGRMHGYRSLEGTFLGGCLFSGRAVGRAVAASVA